VGQDSIARRLDRFLVTEDILISSELYNSWVEIPFISDHAPIILQLESPPNYKI
jgi:endonuclease/exonuclease/phosphatase family metal-dependent hydrolase